MDGVPGHSLLAAALGIGARSVVALAGGGGKTSLAWALARELRERGHRVAVTTTTRMRAGEEPDGTTVMAMEGPDGRLAGFEAALESGKPPLVTSGRIDRGKHLGIDPALADELALHVDHLIVEADGARGLPFKIPRAGEPVVPARATHLVVVIGLAAFDRPLGPDTCFDYESVSSRGLVTAGAVLDGQLARSLTWARAAGWLRCVPAADAAGPLVFVAVNGDDLEACAGFARDLWHPCLEAVIATDSHSGLARRVTNEDRSLAAVVLAAGLATRFGSLKQVVDVAGKSCVVHAVEAALGAGADPVCVVVGHGASDVVRALGSHARDPRLVVARSPDPGAGMATSLLAGIEAVRDHAGGVMVLLADMPHVDASLARSVAVAWRSSAAWIAAPDAGGRTGHPVIIGSELLNEIDLLVGDEGARRIIASHADRTVTIPLADPGSQLDLDLLSDVHSLHPAGVATEVPTGYKK